MALPLTNEQIISSSSIIINCSSPERLLEMVTFLMNCPDPTSFSYEGQHRHTFIVDTKLCQIRVNKWSAPNCIKWYLQQQKNGQEAIPNYNPDKKGFLK